MNNALEVSIPLGRIICTNQMTMAMKLEFNGNDLLVNSYLLEMKDLDVILGIDSLGHNHATIRHYEKEVLFHRPGNGEFCFFRARFKSLPRLLSALQVDKMLRNESS